MKSEVAEISITSVLRIIEEAWDAELTGNLTGLQRAFEPIWPEIRKDPDFSRFPVELVAELNRTAGHFLSCYGKARNKQSFQLRGKDLLSTAIRTFEQLSMPDKAAEARILLAYCFWLNGEILECDTILDQVEQDVQGNNLHPVFLRLQITRAMVLFWLGRTDEAWDRLQSIETPMGLCTNFRLQWMFHNQAGLVFQAKQDNGRAEFHFTEAIRITRGVGSVAALGASLNNFAFFHKEQRNFALAHRYIDEAIECFTNGNEIGWLPHALDTKALLLVDEERYDPAIELAERAIKIFETGEDYFALTDSMWTRCICLIRLGKSLDALRYYGELYSIAARRVGDVAIDKYATALSAELYFTNGHRDLTVEVAAFKKDRVVKALTKAGNNIGEAAELLGLRSHQALSEILNKQFPELYAELGIKRRKQRSDSVRKPVPFRKVVSDRDLAAIDFEGQYEIHLMDRFQGADIRTYFCSYRLLRPFGIETDCVVAVEQNPQYRDGLQIIYDFENTFYINRMLHDPFTGLYCVECPASDIPLPLSENVRIIGSPVGHYPMKWLESSQEIVFYPFQEEKVDGYE